MSLKGRIEKIENNLEADEAPEKPSRWIFIEQRDYSTDEEFEAATEEAIAAGNRVIQILSAKVLTDD